MLRIATKRNLTIAASILILPPFAFTIPASAKSNSKTVNQTKKQPLQAKPAKAKTTSGKETFRHIEELLQQSNKAAALELLDNQALRNTKDPQLLRALCSAHLACGHKEDFYKTLQQWLEVEPTNSDVLLELAQAKLAYGQIEEASQLFLKAHKVNPHNATVCLRAGLGLSDCGHWDGAINALQECYRREPGNMVALETLALICATQHNWEASAEWADCLIKTEPDYAYGYVLKAWSLLRQAEFKEALQYMNRARQLSNTPEANNLLGIFLMESGKLTAAAQELEKLAFTADNEANLVNYLSSLSFLGHHSKVQELLSGQASKLSHQPPLLPQLALLLAQSHDLPAAVRLLKDIRKPEHDTQAIIAFTNATIEEQNKNLQQTLLYARKAAELESESAPLQAKAAELALQLNQYKTAFHLAQQALQLNPSYLPAKLTLGRCLLEEGNYQGAIAILKEVISHNKSDINTWNCLGQAQLAQRDWEAAQHSFERARLLNANNQEAYLGKVACLFAENKSGQAQKLLASLLKNSSTDLSIYLALLNMEERTGNFASCQKILDQALRSFPDEKSLLDYQCRIFIEQKKFEKHRHHKHEKRQ